MEDRKCTGCYTDSINKLFKPKIIIPFIITLVFTISTAVFSFSKAYFNIQQNDKDAQKERQELKKVTNEIKQELKKVTLHLERSGDVPSGLCWQESPIDSSSLVVAQITEEEEKRRKRIANHELSFDKSNYIEVE